MRNILLFSSSILLFTLGCSTCQENRDCPKSLVYELPMSLTPQRDTFNIGDTLFLSMDMSSVMTDVYGGIENALSTISTFA